MDMIEINRISKMLNSTDPELQNLGLTLYHTDGWNPNITEEVRKSIIRLTISHLCEKAYLLGLEKGKNLLDEENKKRHSN